MKFDTKRILIASYTFNFIIILLASMVNSQSGLVIPNLINILNFNAIWKASHTVHLLTVSGYFATLIQIANAFIEGVEFLTFVLVFLSAFVSVFVALFVFMFNQLIYVYSILPSFISGIIILNMVFVVAISFFFGIQLLSSRLGDSN